jgi:hypothetical protein
MNTLLLALSWFGVVAICLSCVFAVRKLNQKKTVRVWWLDFDHTLQVRRSKELFQESVRQFKERRRDTAVRLGSPCGSLRSLCDLVPSPTLRKRVTKLVADQEFHIDRMLTQGRHKAARFNRIGTWFLFFWYIAVGVMLALVPFRQKRSE